MLVKTLLSHVSLGAEFQFDYAHVDMDSTQDIENNSNINNIH